MFVFFTLTCLNLSHAQTGTPTSPPNSAINQTLGSIQPTAPAPADPHAAIPNTPNPDQTLGTLKSSPGKYAEYQSICRTNDYDRIKYSPAELKKKRVDLLKQKIAASEKNSTKLSLRLVKEYVDQADMASAKTLIDLLKTKKLSPLDNGLLNAHLAIANNNLTLARNILTELLRDDANNSEVLLLLAEVYTNLANYYEAITIYEDLNKTLNNAYLVELCASTVLNSLNADGEKICLQAAKKFPENPTPHIYIGISYREREEHTKAIAAFKKALEIKPTEMAATCLAESYSIKEDQKNSVEQFKVALGINPNSLRALIGMAWSEIKLKNYPEALAAFKKACLVNGKYEIELRKAFKNLSADKITAAPLFIKAAESCNH